MIRYAITDRHRFPGTDRERQDHLATQCVVLARAGVDFLQLREKDLGEDELAALASRLLSTLRSVDAHTRLLINANVRVALSIGANGVHLTGESSETPKVVRERYAEARLESPFVSVSCHTLDEVERAREASAILFGPVFGKTVRGEAVQDGVGLDALAEACRVAGSTPVLALGGMTAENAAACLEAGAAGIAGIRLFFG